MDEKIVKFIKQPSALRSIYFIGCMVISFGAGVIVHAHVINNSNQPVILLPKQPIPLNYRYKNQKIENPYDLVPAVELFDDDDELVLMENNSQVSNITITTQNEKNFVASKTGTKYYPLDCGTTNRIKEENKIYFSTEQEAQEKGFERTSTCK